MNALAQLRPVISARVPAERRRSVSVSGRLYDRLESYCQRTARLASIVAEQVVLEALVREESCR